MNMDFYQYPAKFKGLFQRTGDREAEVKVLMTYADSLKAKTESLQHKPRRLFLPPEPVQTSGYSVILSTDVDTISFQKAVH